MVGFGNRGTKRDVFVLGCAEGVRVRERTGCPRRDGVVPDRRLRMLGRPRYTFPRGSSRLMRPPLVIALTVLLVSGCASSRSTARERNPVVFVHGWSSSADVWSTMTERFREDGWPEAYLVVWSYDTSRSNVETAEHLADRVDAVLDATGASRVDIVAHSMGALSARYYVRHLGGDARVDGWVSLGSPNHGTVTAYTCFSPSCREMRPGSSFLSALNEGDETPGLVRYATWRSPCDLVVVPQDSPVLDGATNQTTGCLLHLDLPTNSAVYAQVRDWLAANEAKPVQAAW